MQLKAYRETTPRPDMLLAGLVASLSGKRGGQLGRSGDSENDLTEKIRSLGALGVTAEEVDAWTKAGMPSPPAEWFKQYRAGKQ